MAATAFTGIPFIIAALSSLGSTILAQAIGKRIIFIASGFLMLIGALWNMHIFMTYSWFMVSRVIQAVGWGSSEGLVLISIRDIFFVSAPSVLPSKPLTDELEVHERGLRMTILNIVTLLFTWGSPILGGYISQTTASFRNQLMVVNVIQALAILFMVVFVPETSFDRSKSFPEAPSPIATFGTTTITIVSATPSSPLKTYLKSLHPLRYTKRFCLQTALQPVRALSAPSALLSFLLTGPMVASAYGVANSLSLLFAAMPTFLFPSRLGYIFILPLAFSLIVYTLTSYISYLRYKPPHHLCRSSKSDHLTAAVPGFLLGVAGLLSFGLYVEGELSPKIVDNVTVFSLDTTGMNLSLKTVSLLFGMLVAGSTLISFAASAHLASSSVPTSSGNSKHGENLLQPAHAVHENILIGIFVIGFPSWIQGTEGAMEGIKDTVIAIAVLQIVLASTLGAVLFVKGDGIRAVDRRVLGIKEEGQGRGEMNLQRWKSGGSYFEA